MVQIGPPALARRPYTKADFPVTARATMSELISSTVPSCRSLGHRTDLGLECQIMVLRVWYTLYQVPNAIRHLTRVAGGTQRKIDL